MSTPKNWRTPRSNRAAELTDEAVTEIRTGKMTDAHYAVKFNRLRQTIRSARVGDTYSHVAAPPDRSPRKGGGRFAGPKVILQKPRTELVTARLSAWGQVDADLEAGVS